MDVFISWSGDRSRMFAEVLKDWLPSVVNAIRPWISCADIEKGSRWMSDISTRLAASKVGILCLSSSNVNAPWLNFEAGAISKHITDTSRVCPLLIDGQSPSSVVGPLAQFQFTSFEKGDMLRLMRTLNGAIEVGRLQDAQLERSFEKWWPDLEAQILNIPAEATKPPTREDRDILEEILNRIRDLQNSGLRRAGMPSRDAGDETIHRLRRAAAHVGGEFRGLSYSRDGSIEACFVVLGRDVILSLPRDYKGLGTSHLKLLLKEAIETQLLFPSDIPGKLPKPQQD